MTRRKQRFSRGAWEVERDRFQLTDPAPPPPDQCEKVGDLVPSLMKQLGLENRLWEEALLSEWPALVGEQVARQTRPGRLDHKVLYVFVSHSTWLNELSRYGQKQMLANLQSRFGADRIKSIRLQLDPDARTA